MLRPPPSSPLFPYTTLFRSLRFDGGFLMHHRHDVLLGRHRRFGERRIELRARSEEHTSELQSHVNLVCRLLLEKKKKSDDMTSNPYVKNYATPLAMRHLLHA